MQCDRYRAVLLALEGGEAAAIGQGLRAHRSVQDWVCAYRDGGIDNPKTKPRPGRPTKLPREREVELLMARLDAGPTPGATAASVRCAAGTSSPSSTASSARGTASTERTTCSNASGTPA